KNTACYKFALGKSLLQFAKNNQTIVRLEDLAPSYCESICEHLRYAPRQATNRTSLFLETCAKFNREEISKEQLFSAALARNGGFRYVLDAFQMVGSDPIAVPFYEKISTRGKTTLTLTDELFEISQSHLYSDLLQEIEARWRLVETAWELGISPALLSVHYDEQTGDFYVKKDASLRRKSITSARDALRGYQKGKSFYCFDRLVTESGQKDLCDFDHFFPHSLQQYVQNGEINLDGVWNLVLACKRCNRGHDGKFDRIPAEEYLGRLFARNEFLISSDHPLKETIMAQTGRTSEQRSHFLHRVYNFARSYMPTTWSIAPVSSAVF
ncbi:MAG TPA: HNH endonuclease, partial [Sutterella sp.]|nr:HNH endonuclease [Sutterella sp.]